MPRHHHRLERINSLLQEEIAEIIRRDMKDPRLGFASITAVETSGDLRHAKVKISVMGSAAEQDLTMAALRRAASFVRETLIHRLDLRRMPNLEFILDKNIEYSFHIDEVLKSIRKTPEEL